ncbi:sortase A [Lipingzhangella halophila]|uniref:Sortase A n=1 Tax=Lipingzhangella halophila TaxID=1783352 RepID=A0A7W7RLJ3_9ACTN|nr:class E sortase [Lipingzhangella halophila]MBB4933701.1 sortase A [Lipingzhangella halophila]
MDSTTEQPAAPAAGHGGRGRRRKPTRRAPTTGDVVRGTIRFFGELLFTAGILMLFYALYEVYGGQGETDREQDELAQGLEEQWDEPGVEQGPDSDPLPGSANSRMYIPELDLDWIVVNGVSQEDIRYSPGHYPGSANAGENGNYAVAGHRTPNIFWDLDQLSDGDDIVLEDAENFYTYEVIETEVITPDQVEVVDPDPFDSENNDDPERTLLTLTTCHPKLQNVQRFIVHAEMSETRSKDDGMPENIADMAPENADSGEG